MSPRQANICLLQFVAVRPSIWNAGSPVSCCACSRRLPVIDLLLSWRAGTSSSTSFCCCSPWSRPSLQCRASSGIRRSAGWVSCRGLDPITCMVLCSSYKIPDDLSLSQGKPEADIREADIHAALPTQHGADPGRHSPPWAHVAVSNAPNAVAVMRYPPQKKKKKNPRLCCRALLRSAGGAAVVCWHSGLASSLAPAAASTSSSATVSPNAYSYQVRPLPLCAPRDIKTLPNNHATKGAVTLTAECLHACLLEAERFACMLLSCLIPDQRCIAAMSAGTLTHAPILPSGRACCEMSWRAPAVCGAAPS